MLSDQAGKYPRVWLIYEYWAGQHYKSLPQVSSAPTGMLDIGTLAWYRCAKGVVVGGFSLCALRHTGQGRGQVKMAKEKRGQDHQQQVPSLSLSTIAEAKFSPSLFWQCWRQLSIFSVSFPSMSSNGTHQIANGRGLTYGGKLRRVTR